MCFAVAVMLSNVPSNLLSPDLKQQGGDMAQRTLFGFMFALVWGSGSTRWQHFAADLSGKYVKQSSSLVRTGDGGVVGGG